MDLAGNPIVPSVQRKKINQEANCALPFFGSGIPKRFSNTKKKSKEKGLFIKIRYVFLAVLWHSLKSIGTGTRVQSVHSRVAEIVKSSTICSSPLPLDGYLLHEVKYSLPVVLSAITYFCQMSIFPLLPVGSKCHCDSNSGANIKWQAVFHGPYSSIIAKKV